MTNHVSKPRRAFALGLGAAATASILGVAAAQEGTYSEDEVVRAAERFFGGAAEGLADVVHHVFAENGRPVGYIQGSEGAGALGIGLRYGNGHLRMHGRSSATRGSSELRSS